jgi:hypothetical protein
MLRFHRAKHSASVNSLVASVGVRFNHVMHFVTCATCTGLYTAAPAEACECLSLTVLSSS